MRNLPTWDLSGSKGLSSFRPPTAGRSAGYHGRSRGGSALQPVQLRLTGKAERNKQLEITLWITLDYPVIGVEIQTAPITEEQDGDTGIWE